MTHVSEVQRDDLGLVLHQSLDAHPVAVQSFTCGAAETAELITHSSERSIMSRALDSFFYGSH